MVIGKSGCGRPYSRGGAYWKEGAYSRIYGMSHLVFGNIFNLILQIKACFGQYNAILNRSLSYTKFDKRKMLYFHDYTERHWKSYFSIV